MKNRLFRKLFNRDYNQTNPENGKSHGSKTLRKIGYTDALISRREILGGLAMLPFAGSLLPSVFTQKKWVSFEEKNLRDRLTGGEVNTSVAIGDELQVPHASIGDLEISRMILGGNVIGGWAHARDLLYVSQLVKTYFTDEKIFETFTLAEKFGINAFLTNPLLCPVINKYWKQGLGKIKFISDCGGKTLTEGIQVSIDNGASACYVHGQIADDLVAEGKVEEIAKGLELIRKNHLPAGIGGHKLETVKACTDFGIKPDFWMKTLHQDNYWSANKVNQNDNIWCTDPDEVVQFMKDRKEPWIAYKILAAGAIEPAEGMKYAFEKGADFICLGMFDFQVKEDVSTLMGVLRSGLKRERPWMA